PVVSDFRTRDTAAGGEGAPLVPVADYWLFRSETESRALLNLGGIANVTLLPRGAELASLVAFDTGPGNAVLDGLVEAASAGLAPMRLNGLEALGVAPEAKEALAFALLAHLTLSGVAGNVPGATGARHPVVLGHVTPGGPFPEDPD